MTALDDVLVRPLLPADVPAARESAWAAMREADARYGSPVPHAEDDAARRWGLLRVAHQQRTDPAGSWLAERDGEVVGVALALRRGPLWFLSLLTVSPGLQGRGLGARLLERALETAVDAPAGLIMASSDPKALRRYGRAGFALHPGYDAHGRLDRSALPATPQVREGSWSTDAERVDDLVLRLRGAGYGPDLAFFEAAGARLLVADDGFAVLRDGGLSALAASTDSTAQTLLWAALAEADAAAPDPPDGGSVAFGPLTAGQQWAIDVALRARLQLTPGDSMCTRGALGPLTPYLSSGAFG